MVKRLYLISLLFTIFLTGCGGVNVSSTDRMEIYEMISFQEANEDSRMETADQETIDTFREAFRKADRSRGTVDMADPDYLVAFGDDSFFLWLSNSGGSVIDTSDTHTLYSLSAGDSETLSRIIDEIY
ncbi:hypothetical protein CR205_03430 [Alteribacter lacisalsi]|uniref:YhfM-like domain-containing protein n=1 Tax=Alteribacter lacisalsi TaxID=2045244 RepID=A0A2W0HVF2_9BACI|nr:hypothetical protein [Alteribacter lacisalsi]PYZ97658.1 hypothetical protein CR205_03430 [Alteribacter lacisalsi]